MREDGKRQASRVCNLHEDRRRSAQHLLGEEESLRTMLAKLEKEKHALEERVQTLQQQVDVHMDEQAQLRQQVIEFEADEQRIIRELSEVVRNHSYLTRLYEGTLGKEEALDIIQEILVTMVSSREIEKTSS